MNNDVLIILALCLMCFVLGAFLDHRYYSRAAASVAKERDQLVTDWRELATKAHDERDAIFAKFHTRPEPMPAGTALKDPLLAAVAPTAPPTS